MRTTILTGAAFLALAAAAFGAQVNTTVEVTGGGTNGDNFTYLQGKVKSNAACRKGRQVQVKIPKSEEGQAFTPVVTRSKRSGAWEIVLPTNGGWYGDYRIKVLKKSLAGGTICKATSITYDLQH